MITLADYFMGRDVTHGHLLGSDLRANAARTVEVSNALLILAKGAGIVLTPNAGGSMVRSGWRPPDINAATKNASKTSLHMQCLALDAEDPHGRLSKWCLANWQTVLRDLGLWMEHPSATPTWCHWQLQPHGSFARTGLRYFYPA
jgi:hypothetical protein